MQISSSSEGVLFLMWSFSFVLSAKRVRCVISENFVHLSFFLSFLSMKGHPPMKCLDCFYVYIFFFIHIKDLFPRSFF